MSRLFSNAVIYAFSTGLVGLALSELILPHVVGRRSADVLLLLRVYLLIVPTVLFTDLLRGLLEGTRRFGWAGMVRLIFFAIQGGGFAAWWIAGRLTVATGAYTMMAAQITNMNIA